MTDLKAQADAMQQLSAPGFDVRQMQTDAWRNLLSKVQREMGYLLEGDEARRQDGPDSIMGWIRELIPELPIEADAGGLEIEAMDYAYLADPLCGRFIVIDQAHVRMWGTATNFKAVPFDQDEVTSLICEGHYPMMVPVAGFDSEAGALGGVQA